MKTKFCPKCKQAKDIVEFSKNSRHKDGLHTYCKPCDRLRNKIWYENSLKNPKKCIIAGCNKLANLPGCGRGLCNSHYHRWQRYGDPETPLKRYPSWEGKLCSVQGCEKPVYGHELCSTHLAQAKRSIFTPKQKSHEREISRKSYHKRKKEDPERQRKRARKHRGIPEPITPYPQYCNLCQRPPSFNKRFAVDHDHKTGKFRGWLCSNCNTGLGLFKEDPNLLRKAIKYLGKSDSGML